MNFRNVLVTRNSVKKKKKCIYSFFDTLATECSLRDPMKTATGRLSRVIFIVDTVSNKIFVPMKFLFLHSFMDIPAVFAMSFVFRCKYDCAAAANLGV